MTDTRRYPAHVFWSDEDEGYIAIATDLPGCSAVGDTQNEALRELQDAITAWIEAQRSAGNPVPPPSSPAREHSGKVLVRMPRSLHASLSLTAKIEDVSLNQYIVYLLSTGHERSAQSHSAFEPWLGLLQTSHHGSSGGLVFSSGGAFDWNTSLHALTNLGRNVFAPVDLHGKGLTVTGEGPRMLDHLAKRLLAKSRPPSSGRRKEHQT